MDDEEHMPSASNFEQLPGNLGASRAPSESATRPDAEWVQQIHRMYTHQFLQTVESHSPLQLQGGQFTNTGTATPSVVPSEVIYPATLPSGPGHRSSIIFDAFPSRAIQRPPDLPGVNYSGALPTGSFPFDSISPSVIHGAASLHVSPSTRLLNVQLQTPKAVKQETSTNCLGPYKSLLDAEVRLHLAELRRLQDLQHLLNQHATQSQSFPELSKAQQISKEAQPTEDVKLPSINDLQSVRKGLAERTQETKGGVFCKETKCGTSCVTPESDTHYEDLSEIESDIEIIPSALDMSLAKTKNMCTTQYTGQATVNNSHTNTELCKSVATAPEIHQGSQLLSCGKILLQESLPFLHSDTRLRHSSSLHLFQEPVSKPESTSGSQNSGPGLPAINIDPGKLLAGELLEMPEMPIEACLGEIGLVGVAVSESAASVVAEVGCSAQRDLNTLTELMPACKSNKSTPMDMLGALNSQLCELSTKTVTSSSEADSLQTQLLSVPQSDSATNLSLHHRYLPTNLHVPPIFPKAKPTVNNMQDQVSQSKTSTSESVSFQEQPPPDNKCPICEDKVSGYHYGMYSCESCKGFFKRTIHSKRHEKLKCAFGGGECVVNLRSRKQCAACRFQKCLSLGMKVEAIRQDRQRGGRSLYQGSSEQRRLLKLKEEQQATASAVPKKRKRRQSSNPMKILNEGTADASASKPGLSSTSPYKPKLSEIWPTVKCESKAAGVSQLIQELMDQEEVFTRQSVAQCCLSTLREEKNLLETICHFVNHQMLPLVRWAKGLPMYRQLMIEDQIHLLHKSILSLLCLNFIFYCLDRAGRLLLPQNQVIDLTTFNVAKFNQLVPKITSVANQLHAAGLDMPRFVCLKLIMLLNPDTPMVQNTEQIQSYQDSIQEAFFAHVSNKQHSNSRAAGNLMLCLAAIERIAQQLGQETVCDMAVLDRTFHHDVDVCLDQPCIRTRVRFLVNCVGQRVLLDICRSEMRVTWEVHETDWCNCHYRSQVKKLM